MDATADTPTYFVYILTAPTPRRPLYVGVTRDLARRMAQHRSGAGGGHASRYRLRRLVYVERYAEVTDALAREKQIKGWRRERKVALVEAVNPEWREVGMEGEFV